MIKSNKYIGTKLTRNHSDKINGVFHPEAYWHQRTVLVAPASYELKMR